MRYGLLGPLEVTTPDGTPVDLGGRQSRLVLTVLLVAAGRRATAEAIIDATWGDEPPASAAGTLQSYVSRLRSRLGSGAIVWDDNGYRLDVAPDQIDHLRFEALADQGRALLDAGRPAEARAVLVEADGLWRGPALGEFADLDVGVGPATRLEQRRLAALEDRFEADLQLGRHAAVTGELTEAVAAHPLRERFQHQLALALYRAGRQADALRALSEAGGRLREELGIEPGRDLRALEQAILEQDPSLDAPALPGPAVAPVAEPGPAGDDPPRRRASDVAAPTAVPLVGREAELRLLLAALGESVGDARFVVVEGEPGIGKTRLVDELRARALADGCTAVWGFSDESGAAPALWPWLPPLRTLAAQVGDLSPAVAELLAGDTPTATGQADAVRYERFEAVTDLLDRAARQRPVVVLLDDLQWADAASLELLAFLARRLSAPVLVVGTVRQLQMGASDAVTEALAAIARRPGSRRIRLRGLDAADIAEVLDLAAGRHVEPEVAVAIHDRSEGNPFFAIELARLVGEDAGAIGEVPGSVRDVVRRRLAGLPAATQDLLEVGAVIGRDVHPVLLARAVDAPLGGVLDDLDPALAQRLLAEAPDHPDQLRFSHALVREVLLDDLTSLRRARLHLRVADAIEAGGAGVDDVEILAEHLWRAAPVGVGRRAAEALERAAEISLRRVSYGAAEDLLTKAVQLRRATGTTDDDLHAELDTILRLLEVMRARSYFQSLGNHELLSRGGDLAERLGRRDATIDLLWFDVAARATSTRLEEAAPMAEAFKAMTVDDLDPLHRSAGLQTLGIQYWGEGRISEAVVELDQAVALTESVPLPADPFVRERVMIARCFWLWLHAVIGDRPADEVFAEFDAMIEALGDRYATATLAGFAMTTAISLGRWDHVERLAALGREADPDAQFAFWAGQLDMQTAIALADAGAVEEALSFFERGRDRYVGVGGRSGLTTFTATVGMQVLQHGWLAEGRGLVEAARRELETHGERWNEPTVLMAEAALAKAEGDRVEAGRLLDEAAAVATAQGAAAVAERARGLIAHLDDA